MYVQYGPHMAPHDLKYWVFTSQYSFPESYYGTIAYSIRVLVIEISWQKKSYTGPIVTKLPEPEPEYG